MNNRHGRVITTTGGFIDDDNCTFTADLNDADFVDNRDEAATLLLQMQASDGMMRTSLERQEGMNRIRSHVRID
jgi:hypothetical protein